MATIVFALPILPGKEDVDREMLERLNAPGPEKDAYVSARRTQGLTREQVWHQVTPAGTLAIIVLEGDDLMSALGVSASSDDPFHRQFREFVKDVHGLDLANDPPPDVQLISDTSF
jgi:predicted P-loop ATPase